LFSLLRYGFFLKKTTTCVHYSGMQVVVVYARKLRLPALAIIATATAVATTEATAAAIATTATIAAKAAAAIAAGRTVFARFRFFDNDGAAIQIGFVQGFNGCFGRLIVGHFYKGKTFGTAVEFIHDDGARADLSELLECITEVAFLGIIVKFGYENIHGTSV
jgi:hypothetical protein